MNARPDHYAVLGVPRDASAEDIKRAYRRIALESHPDRFPGDPDAEARFRQVSEAYAVLGDPEARARYDFGAMLPDRIDLSSVGVGAARAVDLVTNAVGELLGTARQQRLRGRDLRHTLTLPFVEAARGTTRRIELDAWGACEPCGGSGTRPGGQAPQTCPLCTGRGSVRSGGLLGRATRCGRCDGAGLVAVDPCTACAGRGVRRATRAFDVRIAPATAAGTERVLEGQGEPGRFDGAAGDLRVVVNVAEDPWLSREGDDVIARIPISLGVAIRGGRVAVPTIDGWVDVDVPPRLRPGQRLRLRERGLVRQGGKGRGDQYVEVEVELPAEIDAEVDAVLGHLDALLAARPRAQPRRARLEGDRSRSDDASRESAREGGREDVP